MTMDYKNDDEQEKQFDVFLRQNVRAVPLPPADHELTFFARMNINHPARHRSYATMLAATLFAAAAVWFFQIRTIEPDASAVQVMEENVEAYNLLLEEDDEVYSLSALEP